MRVSGSERKELSLKALASPWIRGRGGWANFKLASHRSLISTFLLAWSSLTGFGALDEPRLLPIVTTNHSAPRRDWPSHFIFFSLPAA